MTFQNWNSDSLGSYLSGSGTTAILGILAWLVRRFFLGRSMKKGKAQVKAKATVEALDSIEIIESQAPVQAETPIDVELKVDYFRLLTLILIILAATFGVFLLVIVSLLQTSLLGIALSIVVGVITALFVITAVMLEVGALVYKFMVTIKAELQVLKEEFKAALAQNQQLEGKLNALEAKLQNVSSAQPSLFPRKGGGPKKSRRESKVSTRQDAEYLKQAKADAGD